MLSQPTCTNTNMHHTVSVVVGTHACKGGLQGAAHGVLSQAGVKALDKDSRVVVAAACRQRTLKEL